MENEKKSSGMLVGILIGIIIMLLVGIALFATGTINFKQTTTSDNGQTNANSTIESSNKLSESEALNVLKSRVDFAEKYFTTFSNPCGEDAETDLSIQSKDGHHYYKSKQYNSFSQLNSSLLEYMSQDVINLRTQFIKENYLEQNGNLYCMDLAGGSLGSYLPEKTEYTISEITENTIDASIISYIDDLNVGTTKRDITVTLTKNSDNWQITKYEGDRINFFNR